MKQKTSNIIYISIIVLIGLLLRVYRLDLNFPPLYADETGGHYHALLALAQPTGIIQYLYHLLQNGTETLTWFFGLTPLGARLPSAIYGAILVFLSYFMVLNLTKKSPNHKLALTTAAITALLPWSFMISRIGHPHVLIMLNFVLLSLVFYLQPYTFRNTLTCLAFLCLAVYEYPSMIVIATFVAPFVIFRKANKGSLAIFLIILGLIASFFGVIYRGFSLSSRAMDLAIWRDVNTPWEIDKYRALSWNSEPTLLSFGLPPEQLANKLVYNRVMANVTTFAHNYFSFFSPDWLFFKGDAILRHSTGQVGAFYPFLIPFMLYGAFVFFNTADKKTKWTFLIWILASPIPAAITKDGAGYLLRVVTMLPFLTYFCALGLVESFNLVKKNWRIPYGILIGLIGLYSAYYFFYGYFHVYPSLSARSYEYGFKELSDFQVAHNNAPVLVIWDGYYHNNDFRFWQATPFDQYEAFKINEIVVGESHFSQTFHNLYFVNPKSEKDIFAFLKQNPVSYVVLPDRYFVNYPMELDKDFATPSALIKYPDQTDALKIFNLKK